MKSISSGNTCKKKKDSFRENEKERNLFQCLERASEERKTQRFMFRLGGLPQVLQNILVVVLPNWKEFITHYNELNGIFQGFIDEKQLNLLQQQTINKENIGHNYQGDNESTIICSNPVTSRWCGRLECIAENIETISGNNKKQRKCKGCQGIGHDLRNCKSKALGERN
ncbi:hypothetical protein GLOIN_2v1776592 [Rhizophagus irregularis DAOM 181602=DAOM 197198]|nr:hypothetical protein GLOIN_2v1776592 [Rhizophagus irregularis DAOM 181602=DAOM 197198]